MTNLLTETKDTMSAVGLTPEDITFIGSRSSGHSCTWEQFCALADREYNNGFGGQEVADDLEIIFTNGARMWRGEYDGSEWWAFSEPVFSSILGTRPITNLFAKIGWNSLAELNPETSEVTDRKDAK